MTMTTKFSLDEKVWSLKDLKPVQFTVAEINLTNKGIMYMDESFCRYPEKFCFPSRESLLQYIKED